MNLTFEFNKFKLEIFLSWKFFIKKIKTQKNTGKLLITTDKKKIN